MVLQRYIRGKSWAEHKVYWIDAPKSGRKIAGNGAAPQIRIHGKFFWVHTFFFPRERETTQAIGQQHTSPFFPVFLSNGFVPQKCRTSPKSSLTLKSVCEVSEMLPPQ